MTEQIKNALLAADSKLERLGIADTNFERGLIKHALTTLTQSPPVGDNGLAADVELALAHVKTSIVGLESNLNNLDRSIEDERTKLKALEKINAKIDIFETLEILCEEHIKRATLAKGTPLPTTGDVTKAIEIANSNSEQVKELDFGNVFWACKVLADALAKGVGEENNDKDSGVKSTMRAEAPPREDGAADHQSASVTSAAHKCDKDDLCICADCRKKIGNWGNKTGSLPEISEEVNYADDKPQAQGKVMEAVDYCEAFKIGRETWDVIPHLETLIQAAEKSTHHKSMYDAACSEIRVWENDNKKLREENTELKSCIAQAAICLLKPNEGISDTIWMDRFCTLYEHLVSELGVELTGDVDADIKILTQQERS